MDLPTLTLSDIKEMDNEALKRRSELLSSLQSYDDVKLSIDSLRTIVRGLLLQTLAHAKSNEKEENAIHLVEQALDYLDEFYRKGKFLPPLSEMGEASKQIKDRNGNPTTFRKNSDLQKFEGIVSAIRYSLMQIRNYINYELPRDENGASGAVKGFRIRYAVYKSLDDLAIETWKSITKTLDDYDTVASNYDFMLSTVVDYLERIAADSESSMTLDEYIEKQIGKIYNAYDDGNFLPPLEEMGGGEARGKLGGKVETFRNQEDYDRCWEFHLQLSIGIDIIRDWVERTDAQYSERAYDRLLDKKLPAYMESV